MGRWRYAIALKAAKNALPGMGAWLGRQIGHVWFLRREPRIHFIPPPTSSSATGLETVIRRLDPPPNPRGDRGFESFSPQQRVMREPDV